MCYVGLVLSHSSDSPFAHSNVYAHSDCGRYACAETNVLWIHALLSFVHSSICFVFSAHGWLAIFLSLDRAPVPLEFNLATWPRIPCACVLCVFVFDTLSYSSFSLSLLVVVFLWRRHFLDLRLTWPPQIHEAQMICWRFVMASYSFFSFFPLFLVLFLSLFFFFFLLVSFDRRSWLQTVVWMASFLWMQLASKHALSWMEWRSGVQSFLWSIYENRGVQQVWGWLQYSLIFFFVRVNYRVGSIARLWGINFEQILHWIHLTRTEMAECVCAAATCCSGVNGWANGRCHETTTTQQRCVKLMSSFWICVLYILFQLCELTDRFLLNTVIAQTSSPSPSSSPGRRWWAILFGQSSVEWSAFHASLHSFISLSHPMSIHPSIRLHSLSSITIPTTASIIHHSLQISVPSKCPMFLLAASGATLLHGRRRRH